jgi:hypothetical protein
VAGCNGRAVTGISGALDSSELVVMRPFLAALPGAGGRPRRFVDISKKRDVILLEFCVENEGRMVVNVKGCLSRERAVNGGQ